MPYKHEDNAFEYRTLGTDGLACDVCGKPIGPDDQVAVCPDCGAVICKECCEDGRFDEHECDEWGDMDEGSD